VKTPAEVRAEELAKALKVCKRDKSRKKRVSCEKTARAKYGPKKASKASRASKSSKASRAGAFGSSRLAAGGVG
jgi:hypothetical protein